VLFRVNTTGLERSNLKRECLVLGAALGRIPAAEAAASVLNVLRHRFLRLHFRATILYGWRSKSLEKTALDLLFFLEFWKTIKRTDIIK
jgi:hypothetical protein